MIAMWVMPSRQVVAIRAGFYLPGLDILILDELYYCRWCKKSHRQW